MNRKLMLALPLLLVALMLVAGSAFAQTTPAGTQIRNRASATYQDTNGNTYTSLSMKSSPSSCRSTACRFSPTIRARRRR
jgi:hypothetical protein